MLREKITAEYLEQIFRENYSRYYYYALSVVDESEVAKGISCCMEEQGGYR